MTVARDETRSAKCLPCLIGHQSCICMRTTRIYRLWQIHGVHGRSYTYIQPARGAQTSKECSSQMALGKQGATWNVIICAVSCMCRNGHSHMLPSNAFYVAWVPDLCHACGRFDAKDIIRHSRLRRGGGGGGGGGGGSRGKRGFASLTISSKCSILSAFACSLPLACALRHEAYMWGIWS